MLYCENGCSSFLDENKKFYFSTSCTSLNIKNECKPVLADDKGNPTELFLDSTKGVPQEVIDNLDSHGYDCLVCLYCHEYSIKNTED